MFAMFFCFFFLREPIFVDYRIIAKIGAPKNPATWYLSSSLLKKMTKKWGQIY